MTHKNNLTTRFAWFAVSLLSSTLLSTNIPAQDFIHGGPIAPPIATPPPTIYRPPSIPTRPATVRNTTSRKSSTQKAVATKKKSIKKSTVQKASTKQKAKAKSTSKLYAQSIPVGKKEIFRSMQEQLNQVGFDCGTADGLYGPRTQKAIIDFAVKLSETHPDYGQKVYALMKAGNVVDAQPFVTFYISQNQQLVNPKLADGAAKPQLALPMAKPTSTKKSTTTAMVTQPIQTDQDGTANNGETANDPTSNAYAGFTPATSQQIAKLNSDLQKIGISPSILNGLTGSAAMDKLYAQVDNFSDPIVHEQLFTLIENNMATLQGLPTGQMQTNNASVGPPNGTTITTAQTGSPLSGAANTISVAIAPTSSSAYRPVTPNGSLGTPNPGSKQSANGLDGKTKDSATASAVKDKGDKGAGNRTDRSGSSDNGSSDIDATKGGDFKPFSLDDVDHTDYRAELAEYKELLDKLDPNLDAEIPDLGLGLVYKGKYDAELFGKMRQYETLVTLLEKKVEMIRKGSIPYALRQLEDQFERLSEAVKNIEKADADFIERHNLNVLRHTQEHRESLAAAIAGCQASIKDYEEDLARILSGKLLGPADTFRSLIAKEKAKIEYWKDFHTKKITYFRSREYFEKNWNNHDQNRGGFDENAIVSAQLSIKLLMNDLKRFRNPISQEEMQQLADLKSEIQMLADAKAAAGGKTTPELDKIDRQLKKLADDIVETRKEIDVATGPDPADPDPSDDISPKPDPDSDPDPDPDPDPNPKPDPDTGSDPKPDPDSGPDAGPDSDSGPDAGPDADPGANPPPDPDNGPNPDPHNAGGPGAGPDDTDIVDPIEDIQDRIDATQQMLDGHIASIKQYEAEIRSISQRTDIGADEKNRIIADLQSNIDAQSLFAKAAKRTLKDMGSAFDGYDGRSFDDFDPYRITQTDTKLAEIINVEKQIERAHKIIDETAEGYDQYQLHEKINDLVQTARDSDVSLDNLAEQVKNYGDAVYTTRKQGELERLAAMAEDEILRQSDYLQRAEKTKFWSAVGVGAAGGAAINAALVEGASVAFTLAETKAIQVVYNATTGAIEGYSEDGKDGAFRRASEETMRELLPVNTLMDLSDKRPDGKLSISLSVLRDVGNLIGLKEMGSAGLQKARQIKADLYKVAPTPQEQMIATAAKQARDQGVKQVRDWQKAQFDYQKAKATGIVPKSVADNLVKTTRIVDASDEAKLILKKAASNVQYQFNQTQKSLIKDPAKKVWLEEMLARGWSEAGLRTKSVRNSSSAGTVGMDEDIALAEPSLFDRVGTTDQLKYSGPKDPNYIEDVKVFQSKFYGPNGKATRSQWENDAKEAMEIAYDRVVGHSAKASNIEMTSGNSVEAYKDARLLITGETNEASQAWAEQTASVVSHKVQKGIEAADELGLGGSKGKLSQMTMDQVQNATTDIKTSTRELLKDYYGKALKSHPEVQLSDRQVKQLRILKDLEDGIHDPASANRELMQKTGVNLSKTLDSLKGHFEVMLKFN